MFSKKTCKNAGIKGIDYAVYSLSTEYTQEAFTNSVRYFLPYTFIIYKKSRMIMMGWCNKKGSKYDLRDIRCILPLAHIINWGVIVDIMVWSII